MAHGLLRAAWARMLHTRPTFAGLNVHEAPGLPSHGLGAYEAGNTDPSKPLFPNTPCPATSKLGHLQVAQLIEVTALL